MVKMFAALADVEGGGCVGCAVCEVGGSIPVDVGPMAGRRAGRQERGGG